MALLQPCDQGIIRTAKYYYRFKVRERILREIDNNCLERAELCNSVNIAERTFLLDAVHLINEAWSMVSDATQDLSTQTT